jgi:hypothetical protein
VKVLTRHAGTNWTRPSCASSASSSDAYVFSKRSTSMTKTVAPPTLHFHGICEEPPHRNGSVFTGTYSLRA